MQLIITDARLAKSRALFVSGPQLIGAALAFSCVLILSGALIYNFVLLKGAREGWPVLGTIGHLLSKDEAGQSDRFMRENLDAMAKKVGEMQAKLLQLQALDERVSSLAGIDAKAIKNAPGQGGMLVAGPPLSMAQLQATLNELAARTDHQVDLLTVAETRLYDSKLKTLMVPTQEPIPNARIGSPFGWRIDPFNGHMALHTGLDFEAPQGTAILAPAGGVVITQRWHPEYGNMVEIDHGNGLVTRYGHTSKAFVKVGDLVKPGQKIAEVGSTGRSTGPHLHFEVLVNGVQQDPKKFLVMGHPSTPALAQASQ